MTDSVPETPIDTPNEILAAAKAAKERSEAARAAPRPWPLAKIGLAAGIGSAAIAAAVLFAGRRRDDA